MLTKLLKYEFKASARTYCGMYLAIIAASALIGLYMGVGTQNGTSVQHYFYVMGQVISLGGIITLVYIGLCIALVVITLSTIVRRFKGNLLGREGYLMHSLPVTANRLIASKLISATAWSVCGILVGGVSVVVMAMVYLVGIGSSPLDFWREIFGLYGSMERNNDADFSIAQFLVVAALLVLAFGMCLILRIYASIMLGHLAKKHGTAVGIVAFFALSWAQALIGGKISELSSGALENAAVALALFGTEAVLSWGSVLVTLLAYAAFGALYFALTSYLMNTRLDLE